MADQQNTQQRGGGRNKPGAMTMAMQAVSVKAPAGPKVLRIGIIQNKKNVVEERIIRQRETVTVGTSEKNHFIINEPTLPARFEIFQLVGSDYILNFTDDMGGRVGLPGGVQKLEDMRTGGGARNAGNYWQIKLSDSSRGRVVIGKTTILFQFVVPPPVTPRPALPAAARGGFVASIDWLFTAFVVFSYMTLFGFVIYLENADWEINTGVAALPDSVARLIFEEPLPPEPDVEPEEVDPDEDGEEIIDEDATATNTTTTTTTTSSSSSSSNSGGEGSSESQARVAEASARIAQEIGNNIAEQLALGGIGGEGGSFADSLARGASTSSAEDVLATASGVGVATGMGGGQLRTRGGGGSGSGEAGSLGMLAAAQGAGMSVMEGMAIMERRIRGMVNVGSGGGDIGGSGDFDQSVVVRTINRRRRAIQSCYERELRNNPSLAGRVTVQFTIQERGNVTGARAAENTTGSPAVANCVVSTVRRFRFNPGPTGGSVTYSFPFVFAPQN